MLPAVIAPPADGEGACSSNYERQAKLRRQVTHLGPAKRASALILQIDTAARQDCMATGSGVIADGHVAGKILTILCDYLSPGAGGSATRRVVGFLQVKAGGPDDVCVPGRNRFVSPRIGIQVANGRGPPDAFVPDLCMQHAALSRSEKSLALARVQVSRSDFLVLAGELPDRMYWPRTSKRGWRTVRQKRKGGKRKQRRATWEEQRV